MLDSQARLNPNKPEVLAELVGDEIIIFNQSTDVYYRLDRVGGLIWSMLCDSRSIEEITKGIANAFSISNRQAQEDVRKLAEQLLLEKIVVPAQDIAPKSTSADIPEQEEAYTSPRLEPYGLNENVCLRPNEPEVAATIIDGEAIIINVLTGVYYSLDGVGAVVWCMLAAGCQNQQIIEQVAELYGVGRQQVREDLEKLVGQLVGERIIRITAGTPEPSSLPPMDKPTGDYDSPALNIYSDMEDLLALDPPLPTPGDLHIGEVEWTTPN